MPKWKTTAYMAVIALAVFVVMMKTAKAAPAVAKLLN